MCLVASTIVLLSACSENDEGSPPEENSPSEESSPPTADSTNEGYVAAVADVIDEFFAENARFALDGGDDTEPLVNAASDAAEHLAAIEAPTDAQPEHDDLAAAYDSLSTVWLTSSVLPDEESARTVERQAIGVVSAALDALEQAGFDVSQTTEYEKAMSELDGHEGDAIVQLQDEAAAAKQADSLDQAADAWQRYADAVTERAEHMDELTPPAEVEDLHAQFVETKWALAEAWEQQARDAVNGGGDPFLEQELSDDVQALADRGHRLQLELTTHGYDTTGTE